MTETNQPQANPGYAVFRMAKALDTARTHASAATRARAVHKAERWATVLEGMANGTLSVGSRTPVTATPAWATLEVMTGGFATGSLLAGGPLQPHESELLARLLPRAEVENGREALNAYYVTDGGLEELRQLVESGCYDVRVPEEGALLVVSWLVHHGHAEEACQILDELAPWIERLRFFPAPSERPLQAGAQVCLRNAKEVVGDLRRVRPNPRILAQKEAIQIWNPLYDRMVALLLETVEGAAPDLARDEEGHWQRDAQGRFPVVGGWPCQRYPEGWRGRARDVLAEFALQRRSHLLCGKPESKKGSLAQVRMYLQRCLEAPESLTGREVGRVRLLLARYASKRGLPGSPACRELRDRQREQARAPDHEEIAGVLARRLRAYPGETGIPELEPVLAPVAENESRSTLPAGTAVPPSLARKVARCLCASAPELVSRGIVRSGETLATVLPQLTAGVRASGIADPHLRRIYAAIYRAFRLRRSLLLLNLEKQVQLEELPWMAAIDRHRSASLDGSEAARQTLTEIVALVLRSFPHTILPNRLLREVRALAKTAGIEIPVVDELAADIFMGQLTDKFRQAAVIAADFLEASLYQTYYGIDGDALRALRVERKHARRGWFGARIAKIRGTSTFCELCEARAGYSVWSVAANGTVIEQQQILTTQNLAPLFAALGLRETLGAGLPEMAKDCFRWVCRRLQMGTQEWHAQLVQVKQSAYAWRQMVFFLSLVPEAETRAFLLWATEHLAKQTDLFASRFRPALRGLERATDGQPPEADADGARLFLGWCIGTHWLLPETAGGRLH